MSYRPTRKLTVLALDPSVKDGERILRTQIEVPNELLEAGPRGYRVFVVDYDSSADAYRIGARFVSTSREHQQAIERFIEQ